MKRSIREDNHIAGEEEEGDAESTFTPIEFSTSDLMEEMKTKKKRRKKNKPSSDADNQHTHQSHSSKEQPSTQKPFFVVDKKTIEQIDWKPPTDKNWLKGFFNKPSSECSELLSTRSINENSETATNEEMVNTDLMDVMDELDMEAQKYLLNVRFEAQHFCEKTVVASNINSNDFESNRSSMKDMDQSLYSTIHLFDAFESSGTICVSSGWEENFMRTFKSQRNTVQTDIDKRLRGYTTSIVNKKYNHIYPPLNGYYDKWKLACLGEENVYILWEQYINRQHAEEINHLKKEDVISQQQHDDENSESAIDSTATTTTTTAQDETSDDPTTIVGQGTKKKNRRGARKRQKKDVVAPESSSNNNKNLASVEETKIPTFSLLTSYLDYLTVHALFSKMIHWTVSNFHNNSILRRKPSMVASLFNTNSDDEEDEDEEEENVEEKKEQETNKEKWITNYLMNESSNSNNITRCNWLYHLFLAIDKPPNDTIGANMNQLLVWILEHFSIFTPEEKEEFKKLVIIIIKYFGQGNPSIIKYSNEEEED